MEKVHWNITNIITSLKWQQALLFFICVFNLILHWKENRKRNSCYVYTYSDNSVNFLYIAIMKSQLRVHGCMWFASYFQKKINYATFSFPNVQIERWLITLIIWELTNAENTMKNNWIYHNLWKPKDCISQIKQHQFSTTNTSLVVRASDCQSTSCNGPGFDPSMRRHSGIWGAADEAVLNIVRTKRKNYFTFCRALCQRWLKKNLIKNLLTLSL